MPRRYERWAPGTPCYVDLVTDDLDGARAFYTEAFGWDIGPADPDMGGYALALKHGAVAAGVGPLPMPGVPVSWTVYLASEDAPAAARAVTALGGTVLFEPHEAGENGWFFIATDPLGGVFGVWEAGGSIGCEIYNEVGAFGWNERWTGDSETLKSFYSSMFPVTFEPMDVGGITYHTFGFGPGRPPLGGMPEREGTVEAWVPYFGVDSTDRVVALTERAGGAVRLPAWDSPYGRMAVLTDPRGAVFAVQQEP